MTERLYYHDPYVTTFEAYVVKHIRADDRLAVVLDRTFFYPTSGGQPCDKGTINGVQVEDVSIREQDGAVLHLLADEIWNDQVHAEIDWPRRFDHMQQHTGQHILSAAFIKVAQAETIGFHLGAEVTTIDLNTKSLTPAQIEQVENLANEVIYTDRQVRSTILTPAQIAKLPPDARVYGRHNQALRGLAQTGGPVRIVDVENFDLAACGGTHVRHTGEIGIIKIVKLESRGKGLRVEFRCGRRALVDYRLKNHLINQLANEFTVGHWEVYQAVDRLRHEAKLLRRKMRQADERLLEYEAQDLLRAAEFHDKFHIISAVFAERDRREINWLAKTLTSQPGAVVLFGLAGAKSHILFARAEDVDRDMRQLLKVALRVLGSTAGGGRPEMAQGGGPAADAKRVEQAVNRAKRLLLAQR